MHKHVDLIFLKISIGHSYFSDKQGIRYAIYKFSYFLKIGLAEYEINLFNSLK
jgi:hypothetical protein